MIGELVYLTVGTGAGILLGWLANPSRPAHSPRAGAGRTVAEIRSRLESESHDRRHRMGGKVL